MRGSFILAGVVLAVQFGCDGRNSGQPQQQRESSSSAVTASADNAKAAIQATSDAGGSNEPDGATTAPATQPSAGDDNAAAERLYGTWEAENVDSPIGQVKVRLTFKVEGPVRIADWSELPLVGQVRDKKGPYEVRGNKITSDAIRGGTNVQFHFDGDDVLVIEYRDDKTVRFHRQ
ncbi:MAG TPA: hypothetical protein VGN72_14915 [Tepidisphaeraceae bacterium]|jgi:hypothetical protein|nr:hypothetical protein [Tepidisphaeraceae bacterium]